MSSFLGRAKDPEGGPDRYFIETDGEAMTRAMNDDPTLLYYLIKETSARNAELAACSVSSDTRAPGDALEVAVIDADGTEVAEAQVRV